MKFKPTATRSRAVFLLAAFLNASAGLAATYHVAINGNDSNSGSATSPFRTIQRGVAVMAAGDAVWIHAGTYSVTTPPFSLSSRPNGSSSNRFTIQAAPGEAVVIEGGGNGMAATISGTVGVTIKDLTFQNFQGPAGGATFNFSSSPYSEFLNNRVRNRNATGTGNDMEVSFYESRYSLMSGNDIESGRPTQLNISNSNVAPSNIRIVGNQFKSMGIYTSSASGTKIHALILRRADYLEIKDNYIANTSGGHSWYEDGIYHRECENYEISGNVIEGFQDALIWLQDTDCAEGTTLGRLDRNGKPTCRENERGRYINNTLVGPGTGMRIPDCSGCVVENNILSDGATFLIGGSGQEVVCNLSGSSRPVDPQTGHCCEPYSSTSSACGVYFAQRDCVVNNVCYTATNVTSSPPTKIGYNLMESGTFPSGSSTFTVDTTNLYGDPRYAGVSPKPYPYFDLQLSSPARNRGDNSVCHISPSDGSCDIGAYEYGGGATPTPTATPTATPVITPSASPTPAATATPSATPTSTPVGSPSPTPTTTPSPTPVNLAPVVSLSLSPTGGKAPLLVDASVAANDPEGSSVELTYEFGDGSQPEGPTLQTALSHEYSDKGTYVFKVVGRDAFGNSTSSSTTLTVINRAAVGGSGGWGPGGKGKNHTPSIELAPCDAVYSFYPLDADGAERFSPALSSRVIMEFDGSAGSTPGELNDVCLSYGRRYQLGYTLPDGTDASWIFEVSRDGSLAVLDGDSGAFMVETVLPSEAATAESSFGVVSGCGRTSMSDAWVLFASLGLIFTLRRRNSENLRS